jgi:hypothetical protein
VDGWDILYVDRNGNGDLTEAGKRFSCKRKTNEKGQIEPASEVTRFAVDGSTYTITFGDLFFITTVSGKPTQFAALAFEPRVKDAPIFHFGGPLAMVLCEEERPAQGLGESAFVYVLHTHIPPNLHPVAAIEFPNKKLGGSVIKQTISFTDRC